MKIYCSVISLRAIRSRGPIVESSSALCRPHCRCRRRRRQPRSPLACFSQRAKLCALPLLIWRCNWKRLALCAGLRPQRFCLHVGREIPTCTHTLKSGVPLYHDPTSQVCFYTDVLAAAERGRREWTPVCPGRIVHVGPWRSTWEGEQEGTVSGAKPRQSLRFLCRFIDVTMRAAGV